MLHTENKNEDLEFWHCFHDRLPLNSHYHTAVSLIRNTFTVLQYITIKYSHYKG